MNNGVKVSTTNLQNYMEMNLRMSNIFTDIEEKGYVVFSLKKRRPTKLLPWRIQ